MKCNKCNKIVYKSNEIVEVSDGYSYYCNECDEDKFTFEVSNASIDELLTELINLVREDEHFETLCETQTVKRKDLDLLCNQFNLTSTDNQEAVLEISAMIDNICEYIKELIK